MSNLFHGINHNYYRQNWNKFDTIHGSQGIGRVVDFFTKGQIIKVDFFYKKTNIEGNWKKIETNLRSSLQNRQNQHKCVILNVGS